MKIFWFTENYPPNKGGMARSCDRIVSNLRKHHEVDIIHFTNKHKPFLPQANIKGTYTAVPLYEDAPHTLNVLWAYLNKQAKAMENAIFVAYGSHLCLKGVPVFAKWLALPYLLCLRGNDFDSAIFSQKKQDLLYAISNAAAVACVTSEKVTRIKRLQLNEHLFFTPNAIDASSWEVLNADLALSKATRAHFSASSATVIGLVGFLKQKKGIDFFIATLLKSTLSANVHLRIVGEITPEVENTLLRSNLPYSVVAPESQSELIANYLCCDVIAIPSIYDGMPNVMFEAAVLNIPIIASKAGGLPDVLNSATAFLFDALSEASLLDCFGQFKNTAIGDRQLTSKRLKTKVLKEFTPKKEIERYLYIFKQIHDTNNNK